MEMEQSVFSGFRQPADSSDSINCNNLCLPAFPKPALTVLYYSTLGTHYIYPKISGSLSFPQNWGPEADSIQTYVVSYYNIRFLPMPSKAHGMPHKLVIFHGYKSSV